MGPLGGVRVLDLTRVVAGPFCTMLLADLGAEVIKVEMPGRGDDARYGYPSAKGIPVVFLALNRNKLGVTLDLHKPEAPGLVRRLLSHCDVLVENFMPGTMERWGLGYESLRDEYPGLVYASLTGFGQSGPWSGKTSYDAIAQAAGGFMSITGFPDGPPTRGGGALGDFVGGLFMAVGILGALHHRAQTGQGQLVDVSNMDAVFSILDGWPTVYAASGQPPRRLGNRHAATTPYDCHRARDGYVFVGVANNRLFRQLMAAIGRPELGTDPRFRHPRERLQRSDEINGVVGAWVAEHTVAEVLEILGRPELNVPCAPVLSVEELVEHPQLRAREMLERLPHPELGEILVPGVAVKYSGTPGKVRRLGPGLGEHNDEIYGSLLGLPEAERAGLRERGVI